jgi:mannose-6-phosphate isomerase-like protein (cupin superfamily)
MAATAVAAAHLVDVERLPRLDILGPTIEFLTAPADDSTPCIMRGTIPPGMFVPLHSHADPETFWVVSGEIEGYSDDPQFPGWTPMKSGDIWDVPGGVRHAFRNPGTEPVVTIIVSTARLGRFFQEVGVPARVGAKPSWPPGPQEIQRFLDVATRYGYWNASPEENARIGIVMR